MLAFFGVAFRKFLRLSRSLTLSRLFGSRQNSRSYDIRRLTPLRLSKGFMPIGIYIAFSDFVNFP